jgi:hypothetical protein
MGPNWAAGLDLPGWNSCQKDIGEWLADGSPFLATAVEWAGEAGAITGISGLLLPASEEGKPLG